MKNSLLIILSLFSLSIQGQGHQELHTIKTYYQGTNKVFEVYEISANDSIKNGLYKQFSINGNLIAKGDYSNGKKIGIWEYFEDKTRESIWIRYDYDKSVELTSKPLTRNRYMKPGEHLSDLPRFPGGIIVFYEIVYEELAKIDTNLLPEKDSTIYVSITIGPEGNYTHLDIYYFESDAARKERLRQQYSVPKEETLSPLLIESILEIFKAMPQWKSVSDHKLEELFILPIKLNK